MKKSFSFAAVCLFLLCRSASAESNLSVLFVHPEDYSDASYSSAFANAQDRADVQRDIEQHLQRLAQRTLPPGDSLDRKSVV